MKNMNELIHWFPQSMANIDSQTKYGMHVSYNSETWDTMHWNSKILNIIFQNIREKENFKLKKGRQQCDCASGKRECFTVGCLLTRAHAPNTRIPLDPTSFYILDPQKLLLFMQIVVYIPITIYYRMYVHT